MVLGTLLTGLGNSPEALEKFKDNYSENGVLAVFSLVGLVLTALALVGMTTIMMFSVRDVGDVDEEIGSSLDGIDSVTTPSDNLMQVDSLPWELVMGSSRARLKNETKRLSSRSTLNLMAGILFSLMSIGALFFLVLQNIESLSQNDAMDTFVKAYLPRFSVVILIQVLATFFLRMYVRNEKDILKNKNEITNIELKMAAMSLLSDKTKGAESLRIALIKDERNFLIGKSEKAVSSDGKDVLSDLMDLIKVAKEGAKK